MRTLFPSRTVALHEGLNEGSLPHTCQMQTLQGTGDGEGGQTSSWQASGDPLPCRVSPLGSAVERVRADALESQARYLVVFEAATVIPAAARLQIVIGAETLLLDPHGSNGPRSFEAQRKYECSTWTGPEVAE